MNCTQGISRWAVCLLLAIVLTACGIGPVEPPNPEPPPATAAPENVDLDQDGLTDYRELNTTLTDPNNIDTDGDGLKDGQEVSQYHTSPLLADTDGDGLTDFEEIRSGGTSPLLADMPQLDIELFGNPSIVVNYEISEKSTQKTVELAEDKEKTQDTDSTKTNLSIENNTKLHVEVSAGTPTKDKKGKKQKNWPPSVSAKLTSDTTFAAGYFQNKSWNWEKESVKSSQETYETIREQSTKFTEGELSVAMKITNLSPMSIRLKNLVVNVYQPDQTLIGNIKPNPETWPEGGGLLKPGGSITINLENKHVPAQKVLTILKDPTALIFDVASYEMYMVDKTAQETINFDILSQNVIRQTSMISINYGDGTLERYLVATNVERNADGSAKGITIAKALKEIIGMKHETCEQTGEKGPTGTIVLCKLENREQFNYQDDGNEENGNGYGFWTVSGTGPQFGAGDIKNFDDILLKPKQSVYVVYFKDSDGDDIFDSDEYLLGTDKDLADTDGDGLTDYEEAIAGWLVTPADINKTSYIAYANPLLPNSDGDGWDDNNELEHNTDPNLPDTDGDGVKDDVDDDPLGTCLTEPQKLGLAAWWQATSTELTLAKDISVIDKDGLDGILVKEPKISSKDDVSYFSLNQNINTNDQYIKVNNDDVLSLKDKKDFAIAADIIWNGQMASGADKATLVSKGSTFALYITEKGALTFSLKRHVNRDKWGLLCPIDEELDIPEKLITKENLIIKDKQYHILATFTDDWMRIYVDGEEMAKYYTPNQRKIKFACWYRDDFMNLITNQDPFLIGATLEGGSPKWPFKGEITNIQFFNAKVIPDDAVKLFRYGLCSP